MPKPRHYRYDPTPAPAGPIDREAWIAQALAATARLRGGRRRKPKTNRPDNEL